MLANNSTRGKIFWKIEHLCVKIGKQEKHSEKVCRALNESDWKEKLWGWGNYGDAVVLNVAYNASNLAIGRAASTGPPNEMELLPPGAACTWARKSTSGLKELQNEKHSKHIDLI